MPLRRVRIPSSCAFGEAVTTFSATSPRLQPSSSLLHPMREKADFALGLAKEIAPFTSKRINPSPTRGTGSNREPADW